jgi:hypothetical protein
MHFYELKEYISLVLAEGKLKEAEISGDRKVPWGCKDHITDLENRVSDAEYWRNKYPRRSIKRYHWGTVLRQLRDEMKSAKKTSDQNQLYEKVED